MYINTFVWLHAKKKLQIISSWVWYGDEKYKINDLLRNEWIVSTRKLKCFNSNERQWGSHEIIVVKMVNYERWTLCTNSANQIKWIQIKSNWNVSNQAEMSQIKSNRMNEWMHEWMSRTKCTDWGTKSVSQLVDHSVNQTIIHPTKQPAS